MKGLSKKVLMLTIAALAIISCRSNDKKAESSTNLNITVSSDAFQEGEMIPKKYTCDGEDVSPSVSWTGLPAETKSVVLVCDDPDAPGDTWVHWILYNLPPNSGGLPEGVPPAEMLDGGGNHGINSWNRYGYGGPCPPSGVHRYFFKIYALDTVLDIDARATEKNVLQAMEGHILIQGQLMGKYSRSK